MKTFLLLLALASAHGQTPIDLYPLAGRGIPAAQSLWCPGPVLKVSETDSLKLIIGANWSTETPCYVHFNLTPPQQVDPVHVAVFTAGAEVTLKPGMLFDGEHVYVWFSAPTFNPVKPSMIMVGVRNQANFEGCAGCSFVIQTGQVRLFPPLAVPGGLAIVKQGTWFPKTHNIMDSHQIYIGEGASFTVSMVDGGYMFNLTPAEARLVTQQTRLEAQKAQLLEAQTANAVRMLNSAPPPIQQIKNIDNRISYLEETVSRLEGLKEVPTPEQVAQLRSEVESMQHRMFDTLQMQSDQIMQRMTPDHMIDAMRTNPPEDKGAKCQPFQWAMQDNRLYRCLDSGIWGVYKLEIY